ncbi:unnamed protein product [Didymodactylos carnosus]|uniref:Retrotransposon gag domain-containing protein n=1 Tax=Didymodactylos carnosus TaxID=1234261 RepID=A0A8S2XFV8_9BILA|nr:unnamed protein product [Didymodactylos carnosus]
MTDQALMACYKESLINMEKFNGDGTRTIDQFFSNIKRIGSIVNAQEYVLYCMATSKLDAEAARWYENNSTIITTWSMLKAAMTERFKPLESASKAFQKLIERKQQPDESVTNYYDSIVKLCSKYDPKMPTKMIVSCLENGIKTELKTQIKRQMKLISEDEWTPQIFLKVVRNEDELQQDEQQKFQATQPYFIYNTDTTASVTSRPFSRQYLSQLVSQPPSSLPCHQQMPYQQKTSIRQRTPVSRTEYYQQTPPFSQNRDGVQNLLPHTNQVKPQLTPCLICKRANHRTIDCYSRKSSGRFKCGQSTHLVKDCPQVFQ